jgi:MFS family permease
LTAALPAGVTVGALVLGRAVDHDRAESLLPTLALLAPLLLALTALDPSPVAVGIIWFISGAMSAMTVVANRIFVVAVKAEVRGRAFGLAAAGISTAQGVGTLIVGLLAQHLGPSQAVTAVALAAFVGLIVVTARWRPAHAMPMRTTQNAHRTQRFRSRESQRRCCGTRDSFRVLWISRISAGQARHSPEQRRHPASAPSAGR